MEEDYTLCRETVPSAGRVTQNDAFGAETIEYLEVDLFVFT